jgi:molybdopterin/thiamine biosynthesis adenylyltransferase
LPKPSENDSPLEMTGAPVNPEPVGKSQPLSAEERAVYEWQMWTPDFGEAGQERLKGSSVLVTRIGGLGGIVAYELAAAGVGRLILAHAGNVRPSDLNRQLLMTHDWIGRPRIESAKQRLLELNPRLDVVAIGENASPENAARLVGQADVVVDCAPLFAERFALNQEAVRQRKPLVECAMYELEATLTTIVPGRTPCLACLFPVPPAAWKREFPVFGAVSGAVGCLAAMETIKLLAGLGEPLTGRLLSCDLRDMTFRTRAIARRDACPVCGGLTNGSASTGKSVD